MYFGLVLRLFVGGNKFYLYQHAFTWNRLLNTDAMIILIVIQDDHCISIDHPDRHSGGNRPARPGALLSSERCCAPSGK